MSSLSTTYDPDFIATLTAKMLIEIKAVHFNGEKPFIFTSGWASPVYIDCRKIISYPRARERRDRLRDGHAGAGDRVRIDRHRRGR